MGMTTDHWERGHMEPVEEVLRVLGMSLGQKLIAYFFCVHNQPGIGLDAINDAFPSGIIHLPPVEAVLWEQPITWT